MVVCQHFLRGNCRFGPRCLNEHVNPPKGPAATTNAIAFVDQSILASDLEDSERPRWILSSYGPVKNLRNLVEGIDVSPEELRLRFVEAAAANDASRYPEAQLASNATSLIANLRNNLPEAVERTRQIQTEGSNRPTQTQPAPSAFGSKPAPSSSGSPMVPPAAGASAFGTAAAGTPSAFGAPRAPSSSAFGAGGSSGFSAFASGAAGASAAPAFGTSSFGQKPVSAFGAATPSSSTGSAFGQPALGGTQTSNSAFGQSAFCGTQQAPATSAFGQSAFGGSSAFGRSAFGTTTTPSGSAFGSNPPAAMASPASSAFGGAPSSAFSNQAGQSGTGGTAFSSAVPQAASAFGAPSALGSAFASTPTAPTGSAFATAPTPTAGSAFGSTAAFGQGAFSQAPSTSAFATAQPAQAVGFGTTTAPLPPPGGRSLADVYASTATPEADVTEEMRKAFAADAFSWGHIPLVPPPLSARS